MAIKGLVEPGDHVLYTAMEHNFVLRPIGDYMRGLLRFHDPAQIRDHRFKPA